jgi:hypothetical protein
VSKHLLLTRSKCLLKVPNADPPPPGLNFINVLRAAFALVGLRQ